MPSISTSYEHWASLNLLSVPFKQGDLHVSADAVSTRQFTPRRAQERSKVWEFRWWQTRIDGSKKRPKIIIGSLEEYPNESSAQIAVDALRITINEQTPRQQLKQISIATLVEHYREHELPDIFYKTPPTDDEPEEDRKAFSTQETYEGYLKKWILPRWGQYRLIDVKAIQVEQWLKTLSLARGSKAKIRNIMCALYSHAIRWEWTGRNPITHVRQSAKRSKIPTILSISEIQVLLSKIKDPCRLAWFLDATSELRVGELLALKWKDINFTSLEINVTRSIRKQRIGRCKTDISRKPIPIGSGIGRDAVELEAANPIQRSQGLGLLPVLTRREDNPTGLVLYSGPMSFPR
ncbi:MAG: tyrosine-type recombinase/integrase [Terriglobales bacterium]